MLLSLSSVLVQSLELEASVTPCRQHTPSTPTCALSDHNPVAKSAIMVIAKPQKHSNPSSAVLVS